MRMIKLTNHSCPYYVNPEKVIAVRHGEGDNTAVYIEGMVNPIITATPVHEVLENLTRDARNCDDYDDYESAERAYWEIRKKLRETVKNPAEWLDELKKLNNFGEWLFTKKSKNRRLP